MLGLLCVTSVGPFLTWNVDAVTLFIFSTYFSHRDSRGFVSAFACRFSGLIISCGNTGSDVSIMLALSHINS